MTAKVISREGNKLTVQVEIKLSDSMLDSEESILEACNKVGSLATEEALKEFDTDGSAIEVNGVKFTARGQNKKEYQTPYGAVEIRRYVYQTSHGGRIYCPLEKSARIIQSCSPRFAKLLSSKYSRMNARETIGDLENNHGRKIALSFLQNVADEVGSIIQLKEESWKYHLPILEEEICTVAISLDGAHLLMQKEGYREAMVGTISLYNRLGERQHTIYIGAAPEYGKSSFLNRLEREITHVKKLYPDAIYLGIADGAKINWDFLKKHSEGQLLDFYHVTEYLSKVSEAAYPEKTGKPKRKQWLEERCHQLKHKENAAKDILDEMKRFSRRTKLSQEMRDNLKAAITYFSNYLPLMNYWKHVQENLPIGSGVTEAACKTLIKQRFCCSGMKWKERGIKIVLSLRALIQTKGRWQQFWDKINQFGIPALA